MGPPGETIIYNAPASLDVNHRACKPLLLGRGGGLTRAPLRPQIFIVNPFFESRHDQTTWQSHIQPRLAAQAASRLH
ncbi:hypothetical protein NDU88_010689 [Pleurodeles waltl]|uniref:Uncharacterized protein n=1 Tax=Pleurodeles waltl TaxID=8319 RepID=A0AAV7QWL2_PLEWA|nr:hypothetical protein NDU88_010689 [Pleurodeles waltl]